MNDFLKGQIDNLDVKSQEFWDLYCHVADKYFNFDEPDDFQKSVQTMHHYLSKSSNNFEENVIATEKIIEALHGMDPLKGGTAMAVVGFKEFAYTIKITSNPEQMDEMEDILSKAQKGLEDGTIKVKDKSGKKGPFGKKFF